jgi:hypothetical protein
MYAAPEGNSMITGRPATYNWTAWRDGEEHIITRPEDFMISAQQMQQRAHNQARYWGLRAETHCIGANALRIQFHRAEEEEAP